MMDRPYGHDPQGDCDPRLLFYPLRTFPITCDNQRDPVSYEDLKPFVGRDSIVYEFSPDGGTTCWDAASLYMTLCSMRKLAGGHGPYRHPLHGCIVPFSNVELVYLTARTSGTMMKAAMKKMLWDIAGAASAGTVAVAACLTMYNMCVEPTSLLHPLQRLLGIPETDDLAQTMIYMAVSSSAVLGTLKSGVAGYAVKEAWDKRREYERRLKDKKATAQKSTAYEAFLRGRKRRRLEGGAYFEVPGPDARKRATIISLRRRGLPNELIREIGRRAELPGL